MKKIFGFIFLLILFVVSFIGFFPKDKVYFLLQKELLVHDISINSQKVKTQPFSIGTENSFLLLSGTRISKIDTINVSLTGIVATNIKAINSFKNIVPDIKSLNINYTLGKFATVSGDFGKIFGFLDLSNKKIIFEANIKRNVWKKYNTIFSNFKKVGDKYTYEFTF